MNTHNYKVPSAGPLNKGALTCSARQQRNILLTVAAAVEEERKLLEQTRMDAGALPLVLLQGLRGGLPSIDHSRYQREKWSVSDPSLVSSSSYASTSLPFSSSFLASHHADALAEIQKLKCALSTTMNTESEQRAYHTPCHSTLASLPSIRHGDLALSALLLPAHQRLAFSSHSHAAASAPYHAKHQPVLSGSSLFGAPVAQRRLPGMPSSDQYHSQDFAGHFFDDNKNILPLSHLDGAAGESRGLLTSPSMLQEHFTNRSTMLSSSGAALIAEERNYYYNTKTKVPSLLFMEARRGIFPVILHQALLELERVGDTSTAAFLPDGKSFSIRNQYLFEKHVLFVFFPKMKGFASFQRQLNLYDFIRIGGAGIDRGSYRHELFDRGSPSKAAEMKRTKIKGGNNKKRASSSSVILDSE